MLQCIFEISEDSYMRTMKTKVKNMGGRLMLIQAILSDKHSCRLCNVVGRCKYPDRIKDIYGLLVINCLILPITMIK